MFSNTTIFLLNLSVFLHNYSQIKWWKTSHQSSQTYSYSSDIQIIISYVEAQVQVQTLSWLISMDPSHHNSNPLTKVLHRSPQRVSASTKKTAGSLGSTRCRPLSPESNFWPYMTSGY